MQFIFVSSTIVSSTSTYLQENGNNKHLSNDIKLEEKNMSISDIENMHDKVNEKCLSF